MPSKRHERRAIANTPIHSGEVLADEPGAFGRGTPRLARLVEVEHGRISQMVAGQRSFSAEMAQRGGRHKT